MSTTAVDTPQHPAQIRGVPFVFDPSVESQQRYLASANQVQPLIPSLDWSGFSFGLTLTLNYWLIVGETSSHFFLQLPPPLPFLSIEDIWDMVEKADVGTDRSKFFYPHER